MSEPAVEPQRWQSPQERVGCVCPRWSGGRDCIEARYGGGYDPEDFHWGTQDPCTCSCHDPDPDEEEFDR